MTEPSVRSHYKTAVSGFFNGRANYRRSDLHARMAERFVRLAAPRPGERVLDIATGTGFVAIPSARLVGKSGSVVGVDISPGMLEQAAEAVRAAGLDNIDLVQADAEALEYAPERFDLITCCNALPYMADVPGALSRWRGLLRPGGRLVFNCWAEHSHATGRLLRAVAADHGIRVAVIGQETGTPDRCRAVMRAAGYSQAQVIVEATSDYLSTQRLLDVFDSALKSPLFGIAQQDLPRVEGLREEYRATVQTPAIRKSLETENGAYFVTAYR